MLESAGFRVERIRLYGVMAQFASTLNALREERGRKALSSAVSVILSPLYALFCRMTRRGDFLTVLAWRDANVAET
jgi:hypothetical protein